MEYIIKHFPLSCSSAEGLAWFKFVSSHLLPCLHINDVTWDRVVLVHAIMTGVPIDVEMFIYNAILRTASQEFWTLVPFIDHYFV